MCVFLRVDRGDDESWCLLLAGQADESGRVPVVPLPLA